MWSEDVFVMCLLNPTQNKSIPGSYRSVGLLAVLLIRHLLVLFHLLSGWASLHPGEELLSRSWEDFNWGGCDGAFHVFHQVLGWSSCLRSPTNRHAAVRLRGLSFRTSGCTLLACNFTTTSIALSTCTTIFTMFGYHMLYTIFFIPSTQ